MTAKTRRNKEEIKKITKEHVLFWVCMGLTLCFMALIFSMSAQSLSQSEETSGGIVTWIAGIIYGDDVPLTQEMLDPVSTLVRKTAHMGEYAVLFLLTFATLYFYGAGYGKPRSYVDEDGGGSTVQSTVGAHRAEPNAPGGIDGSAMGRWNWDRVKWWLAYAWTVFYAATDEFHQMFTGRGAKVVDVAIDAMGALIGVVALFGLYKTIRAASALRKLGWITAALVSMVAIYALCFLLFLPEVEEMFF